MNYEIYQGQIVWVSEYNNDKKQYNEPIEAEVCRISNKSFSVNLLRGGYLYPDEIDIRTLVQTGKMKWEMPALVFLSKKDYDNASLVTELKNSIRTFFEKHENNEIGIPIQKLLVISSIINDDN